MVTYDKMKESRIDLASTEVLKIGRITESAFTRKGKIGFEKMGCFILNKRGVSLEMEIDSFKDVMGDNWEKVTESAICQQRKNFNPEVFRELNRRYIIRTYDNTRDYETYKGYLVFAIDGMDIELPDVKPLREIYGQAKGKTGQRAPVRATTSGIYDVVNKMMIHTEIAPYKTSERELAKINLEEMLYLLGTENKIVIFDRGYPSLELIHFLDVLGIKYLFRIGGTNYSKEIERMNTEDEVVAIKVTSERLRHIKTKADKEALKQAGEVKVRFVQYVLETGEVEILATNLSIEEFSTEDIGKLYYERWKIELAYDIAKNKLDIQNISGQSKIVVEQEFYAQMFLLNIAEDLRKEALKKVKATRNNGCKYDYKPNMNILIGKLRKRFILILMSISINQDDESNKRYDNFIEELSKSVVPIRPGRKNTRNKYKGYNKHKQNLRRNS